MIVIVASCALSFLIGGVFAALQPAEVPLLALCFFMVNGAICMRYALLWLTSRLNAFDPVGMFGVFGVVFFMISPIYQIGQDYWPFIPPLTGRDGWFAMWGALNTAGLLIFFNVAFSRFGLRRPPETVWVFDPPTFRLVCFAAILLTVAVQLYVFFEFGGISGFVDTFSLRQEERLGRTSDDPFEDLGMLTVIGESFKFLLAMACMLYLKGKPYARKMSFFVLMMLSFLVIFLVFGGLRGSRSSTVFSLIYAAGMYHFYIRKIPTKLILGGIFFVFAFLNAYYWYKIAGVSGVSAIFNVEQRLEYSPARQDSVLYVVSRDMGRMDVQTLAMITHEERGAPLHHGLTYLGAPFTVIPQAIVPWKPESLAIAKSDIVFGPGRYNPRVTPTTIVLGLFGEGYVNFGFPGILAAFFLLGLLTAYIRNRVYLLDPRDIRRLVIPVFCLLPIGMLLFDAGLVLMVLVRALLVPGLVIAASLRIRRRHVAARPVRRVLGRGARAVGR